MFKRVAPKQWLGKRATETVVLSQDLIEIVSDIYELVQVLESLAKPGLGDPVNEVVYKERFWRAQDEAVKELRRSIVDLGRVRRNVQFLTRKGLR
jgi:hypothetical protein